MAKFALSIFAFLVTSFTTATPAFATTECTISIARIFSGDSGYIWLFYTNGGSGYVAPNDANREAILALATTAVVSGRTGTVRYAANSIACSDAAHSDLIAFYLN